MIKKVIYTCITNGYDILKEPKFISEGFDYVCFSDNIEMKSNVWKIRPIPDEFKNLSPVKQQRGIKINPHKILSEYDLSIWIDGSITIKGNLNDFINKYKDKHVYIPEHPIRKCIYDEMVACKSFKKDTMSIMEPQIEKYKKEGFPKKYGLVQSGIILRKHNENDCIELMDCWWNEVKEGSHRDQLSFDYARWKTKDIKFGFMDKKLFNSEWFSLSYSHRTRRNESNRPVCLRKK